MLPTVGVPACNPATWAAAGFTAECCDADAVDANGDPNGLCAAGEGDCDIDADCMAGLECGGPGNCGPNFPSNANCCQGITVVNKLFETIVIKLGLLIQHIINTIYFIFRWPLQRQN